MSNASGKCEGKGRVEDTLGKLTEKEESQEKNDLYFYPSVHYGIFRLTTKSIILKKYLARLRTAFFHCIPDFKSKLRDLIYLTLRFDLNGFLTLRPYRRARALQISGERTDKAVVRP